MSKDAKPFVQIQFDVLLYSRSQKSTSPAATFAMCHGPAYRSSRTEKEQVDMWIDLRDDGEVDIEVEIERFDRDIGSKATVFPFVTEGIRG